MNTLGCIIVPSPIFADSDMEDVDLIKGLKYVDNLLKSLNGSSEINNAFPSGHSTSLLIRTTEALEFRALS